MTKIKIEIKKRFTGKVLFEYESENNTFKETVKEAVNSEADLRGADLSGADLTNTKGMVKIMGVEPGNIYWKKIGDKLINEGYQFKIGLNELREGEVFADDERVLCSYPGFHFASKSWCEVNYSERPYLAKLRIPEDAKINEPWATDGKASADKIEILQVFDIEGNDVTDKFKP